MACARRVVPGGCALDGHADEPIAHDRLRKHLVERRVHLGIRDGDRGTSAVLATAGEGAARVHLSYG